MKIVLFTAILIVAASSVLTARQANTMSPPQSNPPAQTNTQPQTATSPAGQTSGGQSGDQGVSQSPPQTPQNQTPAKTNARSSAAAWQMLKDAAASDKLRDRSDALSALSVMAPDPRATALLENALLDKEESIRVLAATSLGEVKAKSSIRRLDAAMQDASPQVSFAAAVALWKMGDRDGRDIFYAILEGELKPGPGVVQGKIKEAKKDMHDPKALALIAVNQASGAFLGPFSMGVSMAEEYSKNSGAPVQTLCANLLSTDNSPDTIEVLNEALSDKNWAIRVAAAKALAKLNERGVLPTMKDMMLNDKEQPARLVAAAAVIHLSGPGARAGKTNTTQPPVTAANGANPTPAAAPAKR